MKVEINSDAPHPNLPPQGREGERDQPSPTRKGRRKILPSLTREGKRKRPTFPSMELEETLILIEANCRICRFIHKNKAKA
jgi:hypothetical protein